MHSKKIDDFADPEEPRESNLSPLHSTRLSNMFTRTDTDGEEQPAQNRRRRHAIWHPMSALVTRLRHPTCSFDIRDTKETKQQGSIDLCGRFKIGHPLSCNATIQDDPQENVSAQFLSVAGVNGTAPRFITRKSSASALDTIYSDSQYCQSTVRPTAVFLENDLLRCSFPDDTPVVIRINVSGVKFYVLNSTLQRDPFIYSKFLEDAVWLPEEREYFFERDPNVFRFVHNYLRRGEVHLPCGMCGPLLEKELDDWGIPLGLDVQRCCLGPMMNTKFKLESLQNFEKKLEPKYIQPTNWIRSPTWQSFRAKVWQIIDFTPKLSSDRSNGRRSFDLNILTTPYELFSCERGLSQVDPGCNSHKSSYQDATKTGGESTTSLYMGRQTGVPSECEHEWWMCWARRIYAVYETLTVTAAVVVFMLSSCKTFRVPIEAAVQTESVFGNVSLNYTQRANSTETTLPNSTLLSIDIFFSIVITIDLIIRMIFCPDIRYWLYSTYTLIDILSLIPFYIQLILYEMIQFRATNHEGEWLTVLIRMENYLACLKVFIVLRLFRVLRRHRGTRVLLYTIRTTFTDLIIIIVLILESALFFGSAIYFSDDTVDDIPKGFWWALITMTTVGYGDVVPTHTFGYVVAMVCVLTGTFLMAYTVPILVNNFLLYYDHADQLYMLKQLHRSAKHKASKRKLTKVAQKALAGAKNLVNTTWTRPRLNGITITNNSVTKSATTTQEKTEEPTE